MKKWERLEDWTPELLNCARAVEDCFLAHPEKRWARYAREAGYIDEHDRPTPEGIYLLTAAIHLDLIDITEEIRQATRPLTPADLN